MSNILLVDDHHLIFQGFEMQFRSSYELFYAPDRASAKSIVQDTEIDYAVLDISIGEDNGFDVALDIKSYVKKIFFLSMHKSHLYLKKALDEGYDGFFLKDEALVLLKEAFHDPDKRQFWMTEQVEDILKTMAPSNNELYDRLSPREQQVLRMIAEGLGYRDIGNELCISSKTVNVHRSNIMKKLEVENQIDLVKYAIKLGIVSME